MPTRCCWPPDSSRACLWAWSRSPDTVQCLPGHVTIRRGKHVHETGRRVDVSKPAGENVREHGGTLHEVELLEDHADLPSNAAQVLTLRGGHVGTVPDDPPFRGIVQPIYTAQERGFSGAAQTDDDEKLSRLDREAHVTEGNGAIIVDSWSGAGSPA